MGVRSDVKWSSVRWRGVIIGCYMGGWSVQRKFCYMHVEVLCEVMLHAVLFGWMLQGGVLHGVVLYGWVFQLHRGVLHGKVFH